jgi:hypothetical protein
MVCTWCERATGVIPSPTRSPSIGALLRVQVPPRADHSERSEAQLRKGDRPWAVACDSARSEPASRCTRIGYKAASVRASGRKTAKPGADPHAGWCGRGSVSNAGRPYADVCGVGRRSHSQPEHRRDKARQCRLLLTDGKDPIIARGAAKTADALSHARFKAVDQCAAAYIKAHRGSWKSVKHAAQWETLLAAYASPVFGSLPVADVDTELVMGALRPILDARNPPRLHSHLMPRASFATTWRARSEHHRAAS